MTPFKIHITELPPDASLPDAFDPLRAHSNIDATVAQEGQSRFTDIVSGQFDADESREDLQPLKRVLTPMPDTPKLHKVLAQAGLGSRLDMEQMIVEGRITVNNEPAHIGQRVQYGDNIRVNGKPIRYRIEPPPARVIAYHKPVGEVVTMDDPQNRPTVFRTLPKLNQGKWQSVGRLDINTEGLLLFTNSGELANNLMHPRFGLEREYAVRVLGALSEESRGWLLNGVHLPDGIAQFGSIEDGGGEGANCWYRVTISEGRNREVRRLFETVGHAVSRLIRIRYGAMVLPRGLRRGEWMELEEPDIQALMQASGTRKPRGGGEQRRDGLDGPGKRLSILRNRRRTVRANSGSGDAPGGADREGYRDTRRDNNREGNREPGRDNRRDFGGNGERGQGRDAYRDQGSGNYRSEGGRREALPPSGQRNPRGVLAPQFRSERKSIDRPNPQFQPDPMRTSFGYIGAESYERQRRGDPPTQRRSEGYYPRNADGPGAPRRTEGPPGWRGDRADTSPAPRDESAGGTWHTEGNAAWRDDGDVPPRRSDTPPPPPIVTVRRRLRPTQ